MNAFGHYLNARNLGAIKDFKLEDEKQWGLENRSFLQGSRDKALEKGLEDVVSRSWSFLYMTACTFALV